MGRSHVPTDRVIISGPCFNFEEGSLTQRRLLLAVLSLEVVGMAVPGFGLMLASMLMLINANDTVGFHDACCIPCDFARIGCDAVQTGNSQGSVRRRTIEMVLTGNPVTNERDDRDQMRRTR